MTNGWCTDDRVQAETYNGLKACSSEHCKQPLHVSVHHQRLKKAQKSRHQLSASLGSCPVVLLILTCVWQSVCRCAGSSVALSVRPNRMTDISIDHALAYDTRGQSAGSDVSF